MKKHELIEVLASKTGESKAVIGIILESFVDTIGETLKKNESVDITGFAKFEAVEQAARIVRNPKTGETKENPAKLVPKCRFKTAVKNKLND